MTSAPRLQNVEDVYPLTPTQLGMLFHTISEPGSGTYVQQITVRIADPLDVDAFRSAWDAVVGRHEALRAAFVWDGVDQPLQVVRQHVDIPWEEPPWASAWADFDGPERQRRLAELLSADRQRGFDVARAPLMRMHLWPDGDGWRLLWTLHHLIADGWSVRVVLEELTAIYDAGSADRAGLDAPMRFRDHVEHLQSRDWSRAEHYWRRELGDVSHRTALEPPVPPTPGSGVRQASGSLSQAATARVRSAAARERMTLNTVVQGAWAIVLGQWAHERDVVFGVTGSGRISGLAGIEQAVGLFINTVPLRARLDPDLTVGDWLRGLQRDRLDLGDLELTPLASIQQWSGVAPGEPLFDSVVVFENYPSGSGDLDGAAGLSDIDHHEQSNYPLAVLALPGDRLELRIVYDRARYDEAWIDTVVGQLCLVIERLAENPDRPLARLDLVSDADAGRLDRWNRTGSADSETTSIHALVEAVAARDPRAVAVVAGSERLSYADLDRRANGLAHRLLADGVTPGDRVGLAIERSPEMVVAILGILKAGAAYVPLDPAYPEARNRALADDAGVSAVVSGELPAGTATPPPLDRDNDQTAYVIYTSGSTGRPKGVEVTHRNLVHSTTARAEHYGAGPDCFLLLSSIAFDSSVVGIFWTLCTGGTLVLPAPGDEQDLERLEGLVTEHGVTHLLALPSLYSLMLEHSGSALGGLRVAIVAGEACAPETVRRHLDALPGTELHNEYGPTEATVWATVQRLDTGDADGPVPIGRPIADTRVHVLDPDRRLVPIGFPGELWIGGKGVARGYLGRPDLTAERFVELDGDGLGSERLYRTGDLACHQADGSLLYLGRVDTQVKVRGHRIEVTEVEAALRELADVGEAAVVARDHASGRVQLVAYVTGPGDGAEERLVTALRERLPEFMVPSRVVTLAELPRLPNGKVDAAGLPAPQAPARAGAIAPRSETEQILARLWCDLLHLDGVGIDDDYFELGGDSIISIQMISRARQAGIHVEPRDLVRHPTIASLAATADAAEPPAEAEPESVAGEVPLAPVQRWFFDLNLAHPAHWNQSQLFEVPADIDCAAFERALQHCVEHHPQLRARFTRDGGRWRQTIPAGPVAPVSVQEVGAEEQLFAIQARFDLEATDPIAAALLRGVDEQPGLLLIAVHHLVIDVVSWAILTGDLAQAYRRATSGEPIVLPPATASYRRWTTGTQSEVLPAPGGTHPLPRDRDGAGFGTEATTRTARVELSTADTQALLTDAHAAHRTTVEDLLVTALVLAVGDWTGTPSLRLGLEGHGRPDDVDVSRTIGWFTSTWSAELAVDAAADRGPAIRTVKEQLRGPRLSSQPRAEVNLNYLGRSARSEAIGLLRPVAGAEATSRHPDNERPHLVDILAAVGDDRLAVTFHYSEARHHRSTIDALAAGFLRHLGDLLDWCRSAATGDLTPSDVRESGLDQDGLDSFLDSVL